LVEAGGLGAAVSEESMRRLQYCLHWLQVSIVIYIDVYRYLSPVQFATGNIDAQILVLRNFIASVHGEGGAADEPVAETQLQTLTEVKRNVIDTVRQAVDVVSKYAGGALPEPARARVRQFILHLPQRWANSAGVQAPNQAGVANPPQTRTAEQAEGSSKKRRTTDGSSSSTSTPISSTSRVAGSSTEAENEDSPLPAVAPSRPIVRPTTGAVNQAAQRVLTLATESLDMMRSVTGVFKESLDRAEAYVKYSFHSLVSPPQIVYYVFYKQLGRKAAYCGHTASADRKRQVAAR
jgi:hypothetical protein